MKKQTTLDKATGQTLIKTLEQRFHKHMERHNTLHWAEVYEKLAASETKLWSLAQMEDSGGEPDVIGRDKKTGEFLYVDCSPESPKERRSLCYDGDALRARKENKPRGAALDMATDMGVELLNEEQYRALQELGAFDLKTSSWLATPDAQRRLGGALFGDRRYNRTFIYHNGAESYYAARGFRALLRL